MNDRRRVALHEAGHCAVALSMGRTVHEVSVDPKGMLRGYCYASTGADGGELMRWAIACRAETTPDPSLLPLPEGVELYNAVWLSLAGIAAENIGCGGFYASAAESDLRSAVDMIERGLCPASTEDLCGFVDRGIRIAEDRLRRRWDAVERVAEALVERGTLSGADVERLTA